MLVSVFVNKTLGGMYVKECFDMEFNEVAWKMK